METFFENRSDERLQRKPKPFLMVIFDVMSHFNDFMHITKFFTVSRYYFY